jgi:UDP-3-O-[3-hydroxymyristoyl] glucosamine N-acyltransferase
MALTASELAAFLGANLVGDANSIVFGVALPESAKPGDLIYIESVRHQARAEDSAAKCVLVPERLPLKNKTTLVVDNPKLAFAKASAHLLPNFSPPPGIHASAIVASSARLKPNVFVGPYVVIEDDVEIGEGSIIEAFCFLGRGSSIGEKCRLHPRVTLYAASKSIQAQLSAVTVSVMFSAKAAIGNSLKSAPQRSETRLKSDPTRLSIAGLSASPASNPV